MTEKLTEELPEWDENPDDIEFVHEDGE